MARPGKPKDDLPVGTRLKGASRVAGNLGMTVLITGEHEAGFYYRYCAEDGTPVGIEMDSARGNDPWFYFWVRQR